MRRIFDIGAVVALLLVLLCAPAMAQTADELNRAELARICQTSGSSCGAPPVAAYRYEPPHAALRAQRYYRPQAPIARAAEPKRLAPAQPAPVAVPTARAGESVSEMNARSGEGMRSVHTPALTEAQARQIVASMKPRLRHYYDEATRPAPKRAAPAITPSYPQTYVGGTGTIPASQVVNVGGQLYDRLALLNLVPPLNTISADGPSAYDDLMIAHIAQYCSQHQVSSYDCDTIQNEVLDDLVPLFAAADNYRRHPQQNYRIGPHGVPVKNTYIYYSNYEEPLSQATRDWVVYQVEHGQTLANLNDPRVVAIVRQVEKQHCQTYRCAQPTQVASLTTARFNNTGANEANANTYINYGPQRAAYAARIFQRLAQGYPPDKPPGKPYDAFTLFVWGQYCHSHLCQEPHQPRQEMSIEQARARFPARQWQAAPTS